MLFYQYIYYLLRKWDKRAGMSVYFTKFKAISLISSFEGLAIAAVCLLIGKIIREAPIRITTNLLIGFFVFGLVICYINNEIIGSTKRIQDYKEIFEGWGKGKQARWTVYVFSLAILIFFFSFLLIPINK